MNCKNNFIVAENAFWSLKFENNRIFVGEYSSKKTLVWKEIASLKEPFEILSDFWKENIEGKSGILIGYLAYDFSAQFEPRLKDERKSIFDFPTLYFTAYQNYKYFNSSNYFSDSSSAEKIPVQSIDNLIEDSAYLEMVSKALNYIKAGEIYEINLSKPILIGKKTQSKICDFSLFRKMYVRNPAPNAAYFPLDFGRAICSASPECFLEKTGDVLATYPIKGTRKRLNNQEADLGQITELLNCEKERAEHLMVVDLERNDLGRIAVPGSVQVPQYAFVDSFSHVHHLISKICCQIRPGLNIFDILRETFPSGSVTGAPKFRTMQIIRELEPFPRMAYTGSLGFIDEKGDANFSILIRTLFTNKNQILLNVGGGIVQDSNPEFELQETYIKAQSFLDLFEIQ